LALRGRTEGKGNLRFYGGHVGEAEAFKSVPSYRDGDGNAYPCCGPGRICAQHVAQRKIDLEYLGYWYTGRKVAVGFYAHLSVG
jgi:hypothetical protein